MVAGGNLCGAVLLGNSSYAQASEERLRRNAVGSRIRSVMRINRPIFLMRHGQSVANTLGLITSRLMEGAFDPPLTSDGRASVARIVSEFAKQHAGQSFEVVASPFLRTKQTADILCESTNSEYKIDSRLRERDFGKYDGTSDQNYALVWTDDEEGISSVGDLVEPLSDVFARVKSLIGDLDGALPENPVILCTHGDVASITIAGFLYGDLSIHRKVGVLATGEIRSLVSP
jgi:broad specificity phosphatase PhoE